jgi:hypothetical protein
MSGRDAISTWLTNAGIPAELSKSGRIAEQVLNAVGGLWGCHLLADKETLQLLDKMSKRVRRYPDDTVEEFPDRTCDARIWDGLVKRRRNDSLGQRLSLDNFVKANILKQGLGIDCPACKKNNWYGIGDLKVELTCEQCLRPFAFPQGSIDFNNTPWKYRVVGPFTVPDYADGAYATVLTLRTLALNLGSGHASVTCAAGLDLTLDPALQPGNVDLALWYRRDNLLGDSEEEPALIFGEAKSFGSQAFQGKEIDRMRRLAERFPGAFILFSTLRTELSTKEKSAITALSQWGREIVDRRMRSPVIVLTGHELFSPWYVQEAWKDLSDMHKKFAEPALRLDKLETLADVTQQLYLKSGGTAHGVLH